MTNDQLLDEIREANLSYLLLAQNMIRADRAQAMYRLGISAESADMLANLTLAQCLKIAARNVLICRFRFEDDMVWGLLTDHGREASAKQLHASILLASRAAETVA
jgi:flagellar transcriptional activator FlhD